MAEDIEIRGGAGEFEAAVIAVVLDRIAEDERTARQGPARNPSAIPPWTRADAPVEPNMPMDVVRPRRV